VRARVPAPCPAPGARRPPGRPERWRRGSAGALRARVGTDAGPPRAEVSALKACMYWQRVVLRSWDIGAMPGAQNEAAAPPPPLPAAGAAARGEAGPPRLIVHNLFALEAVHIAQARLRLAPCQAPPRQPLSTPQRGRLPGSARAPAHLWTHGTSGPPPGCRQVLEHAGGAASGAKNRRFPRYVRKPKPGRGCGAGAGRAEPGGVAVPGALRGARRAARAPGAPVPRAVRRAGRQPARRRSSLS
jgi:hypothetical protein